MLSYKGTLFEIETVVSVVSSIMERKRLRAAAPGMGNRAVMRSGGEHNNGRRGNMSGGKRDGAGRKPGPYGCKVTLAVRVSPDVKAYLAATGNMSNATDEAVRRSTAFRQWSKAQQQRG